MNSSWSFPHAQRAIEQSLDWCISNLLQPEDRRVANLEIVQKWEMEQFQKRARGGDNRHEAEARLLLGLYRQLRSAFDILVSNRVRDSRLYEVRRRAHTGEEVREVNEDRIRKSTLIELNDSLHEGIGW